MRNRVFVAYLVSIWCLGPFNQVAQAGLLDENIANFHEVSPILYRGAKPTNVGIVALELLGVKTVIDLQSSSDPWEKDQVVSSHMRYVSLPVSGIGPFPKEVAEKFLKIVMNPKFQPVFVHCRHGEDRTGTAVGLYRVYAQNWTAKEAYDEMKKRGFHPTLYPLYLSYWKLVDPLDSDLQWIIEHAPKK